VRTGLVAAGVLVATAAGVQGQRAYAVAQRTTACERSAQELDAVWSPERRQALREALVATGQGHAEATAERLLPWLDRQATAWQHARVEACLDARVRGTVDDEQLERAQWCLDERRMELAALVDQLLQADATMLLQAVPAAASLRAVDACRDARVLQTLPVPQHEDREAIAALRASVLRTGLLRRTGRPEAGVPRAREELEQAEARGWPPLTAAARVELGVLLEQTGAYAEAEAVLEEAYFEATRAAVPEIAVDAATWLVFVVGNHQARHAEAQRWGRYAQTGLTSVRDGAALARARLGTMLAVVHRATGAYDEARAELERALVITEEALGSEHPSVAKILLDLALTHRAMGAYDQAQALLERALAIDEQTLGPQHPTVAAALANLANVHLMQGDLDQARALDERALAIDEQTLGPEHPTVAKDLNNLANARRHAGDLEPAALLYERAIAIAERTLGPEHPTVAGFLGNLAATRSRMGAYDQALSLYRRALAIHEQALGPDHPSVAADLVNLGTIHQISGAHAEAMASYERALAIQEAALGPDHPDLAAPLVNRGDLHRMQGALDRAWSAY
ncbi:MAG: tetratricopeptide repeat protein, partial [Myxococcales bacterium]|nr:tetratricopeptide repeat protein [Myxococcales bacterium]